MSCVYPCGCEQDVVTGVYTRLCPRDAEVAACYICHVIVDPELDWCSGCREHVCARHAAGAWGPGHVPEDHASDPAIGIANGMALSLLGFWLPLALWLLS